MRKRARIAGVGTSATLAALFVCAMAAGAQASGNGSGSGPGQIGAPAVLDRVVAVVNNQAILASDLDFEMRVYRLLPVGSRRDLTPESSLERLTTRALIEQQIVQEDPHGLEVSPKDLAESLAELRQNLPACRHRDCATAAGWKAFLATLGLTPERVSEYWARRMAVLRFIELRFRSGIRIAPEEIEKYYKETLVPKYASPEDAPALAKIAPRIQEVLLQQRVNTLLNEWLKSLQDQGQVEILDPALRKPETGAGAESGAGSGTGASPGSGGGPR